MVEKGGTSSAKLCDLQSIFCVQDAKYKVKFRNFLHELGRSWKSLLNTGLLYNVFNLVGKTPEGKYLCMLKGN